MNSVQEPRMSSVVKTKTGTGTASFARDILPLFRTTDIQQMNNFGVRLGDHSWMSQPQNARNVFLYLAGVHKPQMPLGGPYWAQEQLALFRKWMEEGYPP